MQPHIIIADDHSMVRKGVKLLLFTQIGCKNVYEVNSCNALMNELKKQVCTHLILDMIFSDCTAIELVPVIKELYPSVKIMLFTMQLDEVYAEAFRKYNVNYYLNKSTNEEETVVYIRRFLNNEPAQAQSSLIAAKTNPFSNLAPKELEILHYLLNGYKTNSIATSLNLSSSTVSTVKKRIFEKTETLNLAQLLELALLYNISF